MWHPVVPRYAAVKTPCCQSTGKEHFRGLTLDIRQKHRCSPLRSAQHGNTSCRVLTVCTPVPRVSAAPEGRTGTHRDAPPVLFLGYKRNTPHSVRGSKGGVHTSEVVSAHKSTRRGGGTLPSSGLGGNQRSARA